MQNVVPERNLVTFINEFIHALSAGVSHYQGKGRDEVVEDLRKLQSAVYEKLCYPDGNPLRPVRISPNEGELEEILENIIAKYDDESLGSYLSQLKRWLSQIRSHPEVLINRNT